MKKNMKALLSVLMVAILAFGTISTGFFGLTTKAFADERQGEAIAPNADSQSYWKFYKDGELRFTGNIPAIADGDTIPWTNFIKDIVVVSIDNSSVKSIGAYGLKGIQTAAVYVPVSVEAVDSNAFAGSSIKTVYYGGSNAQWKNTGYKGTDVTVVYGHVHTPGLVKHSTNSTCSKNGYEGDIYCSVCGAFWKNGETLPKAEHEWNTIRSIVKEATCNEDGIMAFRCKNCNAVKESDQKSIPSTGKHEWIVLPDDKFDDCDTVTKEQRIVLHCKYCNVSSADEQFKLVELGEDATVAEIEKAEYNKMLDELATVKKAEGTGKAIHHYVYDTTAPTCTAEGFTTVTCSYCKKYNSVQDKVPALGHNSDEPYRNEPTCTNEGEEGTKCTRCGEIQSSKIIANLHTAGNRSATYVTKQEATCVDDGFAVLVCNYCGKEIEENGKNITKVLNKHPDVHSKSRWITITNPTCTEAGEKIQICTVPNCQYHSETDLGKAVDKVSDRKAIDVIIAVVKDTNKSNFGYDQNVVTENRVYDVADAINLKILAAYQKGNEFADESTIRGVFTTAMQYHGYLGADNEGSPKFYYDKDNYNCVNETANSDRFVYSEIIEKAVAAIVEDGSVINTTNDIVTYLENAWLELGDEEIASVIDANPDQRASVINKAVDKKEIEKTDHKYERVAYYIDNSGLNPEYVPVAQSNGEWHVVSYASGEFVLTDVVIADDKVVTEINCLNGGGVIVNQCEYCGKLQVAYVEKGSHEKISTPVAPTCTENGYTEITCKKCDYREIIEGDYMIGHNYQEVTIKETSCSKNGITVKICKNCGDIDKSTYKTIPLAPHKDVDVHVEATCTEAGYTGKQCTVCKRFDTTVIDPLGHNMVTEVFEPTCYEYGYTSTTCSRCGTSSISSIVPSPGHQYGTAKNISATCEVGSYTSEICTKCNYEKKTNVLNNAIGHEIVADKAVAPTCTKEGLTAGSHCGRPGCPYVEKEQKVIPATGHTEVKVSKKNATCKEAGYEAYSYCSVCKEELVKKVTIEKTDDHTIVTDKAVAATCTQTGLTEGSHCSVCNKVIVKQTVIPKLNHTVVANPKVEPSCTEVGHEAGSHCSVCNMVIVESTEIPAKGHTYGEEKVTKEATAFSTGEKTAICTACGDAKKTEYSLSFLQKIIWIFTKLFSVVSTVINSVSKLFA